MHAGLAVVLRRDMSLNRRLYAWLDSGDGLRNDKGIQDVLVAASKARIYILNPVSLSFPRLVPLIYP